MEYEYLTLNQSIKTEIISFLKKFGFNSIEIELIIFFILTIKELNLNLIQTGIKLNTADIDNGIKTLTEKKYIIDFQRDSEKIFEFDIIRLKRTIERILKKEGDKNLKSNYEKLSPILFQQLRTPQVIKIQSQRVKIFEHIQLEESMQLLKEHFRIAQREILIQSYYLKNLFDLIKEELKNSLLNCVNIKVLLLHPNSDLIEQPKHKIEIKQMFQRISSLNNEIKELKRRNRNIKKTSKLEIRYYGKKDILNGVFRGYIFDEFSAFITLWRFKPQGRGIDAPILNIKDYNSMVFLLRKNFLEIWRKSGKITKLLKQIGLISIFGLIFLIILFLYMSIPLISIIVSIFFLIFVNIFPRVYSRIFDRKVRLYED